MRLYFTMNLLPKINFIHKFHPILQENKYLCGFSFCFQISFAYISPLYSKHWTFNSAFLAAGDPTSCLMIWFTGDCCNPFDWFILFAVVAAGNTDADPGYAPIEGVSSHLPNDELLTAWGTDWSPRIWDSLLLQLWQILSNGVEYW